ncbi:dihydroorotase [Keratinibaculum paraultunense]|uniref:Dihydroorotase n=1 Tax=Keratinibaculum paraultunense TaxID=1278232 RepID=A0A4R3KZ10_9FIRM|nr:dihydroorotase [Keratinibaculum paraultunense]QQY80329.1 dihydroorotase [Keratinibaculum paraultunense]TCS90851.1 dihydroorotase [Keratinibaculum paraultunense]
MEVLIKNCRVIDETKDFVGDIYIKDGKITDFGAKLSYPSPSIDARNLAVMPSFIDMHAHFREPGYTYKEDIYTGSLAALKGGYTLVNLMANTNPICSSLEVVDFVLDKAKKLDLIDIHQSVSITKDFDGKTLQHLEHIDPRIKFISDDGKGVQSNLVMYQAMKIAKEKGLTIIAHEEDEDIVYIDTRLSENLMTLRDIYLSKLTGASLHLAHVSTKESIEWIRKAKKEIANLSCEVTPHHIALYDLDYKVNPPIRKKEDVRAIVAGIKDGTVDVISTDHAPHSKEDKEKGSPGISGLETAFPICYTYLVKKGEISLNRLSQLMSATPGRLMGVNKGKIKVGYDGDIVLLDLDKEFTIDEKDFVSKGKNTPFNGKKVYGKVVATIRKGELKYNGGINIDNR